MIKYKPRSALKSSGGFAGPLCRGEVGARVPKKRARAVSGAGKNRDSGEFFALGQFFLRKLILTLFVLAVFVWREFLEFIYGGFLFGRRVLFPLGAKFGVILGLSGARPIQDTK